ncbi:MAG: PhzF family phenazine biosynthesis protein [Spirochaetota bacterium]|nr:PhzF family phenazine biosynthesis protein [Spirochaetota bacterium]
MSIPIFQVDAFTDQAFSGNPAAVCILNEPQSDEWMQNVASEMNLSDTAFIMQSKGRLDLRWFTPAVEVDLCGHATLAAAHILWKEGYIDPAKDLSFSTKSGVLTAKGRGQWIELAFPYEIESQVTPPDCLSEALGAIPVYVGKNRMDYLVELESETAVRNLSPDLSRLKPIPTRGFIVTARSDSDDYDFISRFFAPGAGIDEDPVTGSTHCCLGPYWQKKTGKNSFMAYQASKRGGFLRVRMTEKNVILEGQAVTIFRGVIH